MAGWKGSYFTFHFGAINTEHPSEIISISGESLHSTLEPLIQFQTRRRRRSLHTFTFHFGAINTHSHSSLCPPIPPLHSTLEPLIPCRLCKQLSVRSGFTFHFGAINTVSPINFTIGARTFTFHFGAINTNICD